MPVRPIFPDTLPVLPDEGLDTDQAIVLRNGELYRSPFPESGGAVAVPAASPLKYEIYPREMGTDLGIRGNIVSVLRDGRMTTWGRATFYNSRIYGIMGDTNRDNGRFVVYRAGYFGITIGRTITNFLDDFAPRQVFLSVSGSYPFHLITLNDFSDNVQEASHILNGFQSGWVVGDVLGPIGPTPTNRIYCWINLIPFNLNRHFFPPSLQFLDPQFVRPSITLPGRLITASPAVINP